MLFNFFSLSRCGSAEICLAQNSILANFSSLRNKFVKKTAQDTVLPCCLTIWGSFWTEAADNAADNEAWLDNFEHA